MRYGAVSAPDFKDLPERARTFQGLVANQGIETSLAVGPGQAAASRFGVAVSSNFFDVLRVPAALGRTFAAGEDDVPNRDAVVVLSHNTWTQQFDADPSIVGRTVQLGARGFTVIGVAAAGFTGLDIFIEAAFYVPLAMAPALMPPGGPRLLDRRDIRTLRVVGRLADGVSIQQADEDLRVITEGLARTNPSTNEAQGLAVRTEMATRMDNYLPSAMLGVMLMGLAIAVLAVACANVAGLLTSRAPARQREIAVRLAMGGSRRRVLRQLLTESLLMAAAGGALGVVVAYAGIRSFQQFQIISDAGARITLVLDERALVVALVVAVASALMAGLLPAWRASRGQDLAAAMRITTAGPSRPSRPPTTRTRRGWRSSRAEWRRATGRTPIPSASASEWAPTARGCRSSASPPTASSASSRRRRPTWCSCRDARVRVGAPRWWWRPPGLRRRSPNRCEPPCPRSIPTCRSAVYGRWRISTTPAPAISTSSWCARLPAWALWD